MATEIPIVRSSLVARSATVSVNGCR